jgi:SAM-dependent methyltransferase
MPSTEHSAVDHYKNMSGRNQVPLQQLQRKLQDRLAAVKPLLQVGDRILEIGCAEGEFGALVKAHSDVEYAGLEISLDAGIAAARLDKVLKQPAATLPTVGFDLLLSFHVLEHITDIAAEIRHWIRQLEDTGTIVIEVPNAAGHPLRGWDTHPEHLHFFSVTSLSALLEHAGLSIQILSSGHYESPVYPDSLRVVARRALNADEKAERLLSRFRQQINGPFVIYGIGGDFRNCVLPILDRLPVVALIDSDSNRAGEQISAKHAIQAYDPAKFAGLPILIASIRFKSEIRDRLRASINGDVELIGLDDVYEMN